MPKVAETKKGKIVAWHMDDHGNKVHVDLSDANYPIPEDDIKFHYSWIDRLAIRLGF